MSDYCLDEIIRREILDFLQREQDARDPGEPPMSVPRVSPVETLKDGSVVKALTVEGSAALLRRVCVTSATTADSDRDGWRCRNEYTALGIGIGILTEGDVVWYRVVIEILRQCVEDSQKGQELGYAFFHTGHRQTCPEEMLAKLGSWINALVAAAPVP